MKPTSMRQNLEISTFARLFLRKKTQHPCMTAADPKYGVV